MKHKSIFFFVLSILITLPVMAGDTAKEKEFRIAAGIGDVDTLTRLLDEGVSVDTSNKFGVTALMMMTQQVYYRYSRVFGTRR